MKKAVSVLAYIVVAYGLAWLVTWPLWQSGGLHNPLFLPLTVAMMFTPAVAALVVGKIAEPKGRILSSLGIALEPGSLNRIVLYCLLAIVLSLVINLGALAVGQAFGVYHLDLVNFSAFREIIAAKLQAAGKPWPAAMPPLKVLAALQLVTIVIFAPINAIAAVGEEIGWRGFLLPRLMPMGAIPAVVLGGVIWALWHAPVILLGYNYPAGPRWWALTCMSGMCIVLGAVLAWLRLRTRSVWPCALFHGAINAGAGMFAVLGMAGETVNFHEATILGWSGWIIPSVLAVVLALVWPAKRQSSDHTASSLPEGSQN